MTDISGTGVVLASYGRGVLVEVDDAPPAAGGTAPTPIAPPLRWQTSQLQLRTSASSPK